MFVPNGKESFHDLQFEDFLTDKIFLGLVEDNKDPSRFGRIRVRVQGVFNDIPVEHIPWASPFRNLDGKNFSVPAIGKIVSVTFSHGNLYEPQYNYSEKYNINLQNKLKNISEEEYVNFTALLFDDRTQIYSDDTALNMDYYNNAIQLKKTSIDIKLKDNTQKLNLGHSDCNQEAVLGTNFFKWMDSFIDILAKPSTLTGNMGSPILRPELDSKILEYKALRSDFLSRNVSIVENSKIEKDEYDSKRKNIPYKDDNTKINYELILKTNNVETKEIKEKITTNRKIEIVKSLNNEPVNEDKIEKEKEKYDIKEESINNNKNTDDPNAYNYLEHGYTVDDYVNKNTISPTPEFDPKEVKEKIIEKKTDEIMSLEPDEYIEYEDSTAEATVIDTNDPIYDDTDDPTYYESESPGYGTYEIRPAYVDTYSDGGGGTGSVSTSSSVSSGKIKIVSVSKKEMISKITKYGRKYGMSDAAIAGIIGCSFKESGLVPTNEWGYGGTNATNLKRLFSGRSVKIAKVLWGDEMKNYLGMTSVEWDNFTCFWYKDKKTKIVTSHITDAQLVKLSKHNLMFYDCNYGVNGAPKGDAFKYRGRGLNQITFKGSYNVYNKDTMRETNTNIIDNPDALNIADNAALCLVTFMLSGFKKRGMLNTTDLDQALRVAININGGGGDPQLLKDINKEGYAKASPYMNTFYNEVKAVK